MKTFHIQRYNNEGVPLDKFDQFTMRNNEDFSKLLKRIEARGLENIKDNNEVSKIITSLEDIQANEFYRINASYLMAVKNGFTWTQVEDMALEDETRLAVENIVNKVLKYPVTDFPDRVMHDETGKPIMEWDGIFLCYNKVFLCELKHKMTEVSIKKIN
jgi:hypothetical protein